MIIEVKVPQLSESVSEATLLEWHKKEGEAVSRDENLIDIETDKVVMELPAPADGVLTKVLKADRVSVVSGEVIATIDTEAKPAPGAAPEPAGAAAAPASVAPKTSPPASIRPPRRPLLGRAAASAPTRGPTAQLESMMPSPPPSTPRARASPPAFAVAPSPVPGTSAPREASR